jgi:hypothetical protein
MILRAAPAILAAAIGFTINAQSARALSGGAGFTVTGNPGTTLLFDVYPNPFEASVTSSFDAGAAIDGGPGFFTLNFSGSALPAAPYYGSEYQQVLQGKGYLTLDDSSYNEIASVTLNGGIAYATPGASSAVIQLDVASFAGTLPVQLSSGYLILQGSTFLPVALVETNPTCSPGQSSPCPEPYFDPFRLDWTADYQATPYAATSGAVPEPSIWAMLIVGFVGLGFAGWRRDRGRAAVA